MNDITIGMDVFFIDPDIKIQRGTVRSIAREEPEESHFDCIFIDADGTFNTARYPIQPVSPDNVRPATSKGLSELKLIAANFIQSFIVHHQRELDNWNNLKADIMRTNNTTKP